jgi:hypothetical protein
MSEPGGGGPNFSAQSPVGTAESNDEPEERDESSAGSGVGRCLTDKEKSLELSERWDKLGMDNVESSSDVSGSGRPVINVEDDIRGGGSAGGRSAARLEMSARDVACRRHFVARFICCQVRCAFQSAAS